VPAASVVDLAIEEIADGLPVDWPALESGASDEEREFLKYLRILDGLVEVHRSTDEERSADASVEDTVERVAVPAASEPSEMWGRYRLLEKIGEGGFGSVYRGWDPELEREVAIKILHYRIASTDLKERLLREGRALARIRHANVVAVYGVESHADRVGLGMEFIRGETLDSVLRTHGTLNAREAMLIVEDVCRALAAVHRAGFVHRDVKARNVMREHGGRVVLMDFGTGRATEQTARAGGHEIAGTPVYMAPEVLAGGAATPGSDVYAVGVLLYHLVTGEYPVEGRTMNELRAAHGQGRRKLLTERRPDLPMPFVQVVERALAPDPQQRWTTAAALLQALGAIDGSSRLRFRFLMNLALGATGTFVGLVLLGMLTSRVFNASLGRSEFANESVWDWLLWGARSCVGPAVFLLMAFASFGLGVAVRRVLLAASERARRADAVVRRVVQAVARRLHLDDPSVLASLVLLLSGSALLLAWWHFSPLYAALFTDLSTAPATTLRMVAPVVNGSPNADNIAYRKTFSWISIGSVILWYFVARLAARKGERLHWGVIAGASATILLALASLDYPYRLFNNGGTQFDGVRWQGQDCYILGERGDDLLLFCPALQPSRNRIVKKADATLERTGVHESLFAPFGQNPGPR
jgi:predicted Ser/Thr protein kinase